KLQKDEIKTIVELLLQRIRASLAERELQLELSEPAKDLLVEKGWDPAMGARPLRRAIQRYIEDPLADFVLRAELKPGATVLVEPGTEEGDEDVKLSILQPVPAGVGGDGEPSEDPQGSAAANPRQVAATAAAAAVRPGRANGRWDMVPSVGRGTGGDRAAGGGVAGC